jgi:hypothetical protein
MKFTHLLDGGAKKKNPCDFRIISRQGSSKKGTPSKESSKKDDLKREKFPL